MGDQHKTASNEHNGEEHPKTLHLVIAFLKDKYNHAEYCSQKH
jgi:hypothetical protein